MFQPYIRPSLKYWRDKAGLTTVQVDRAFGYAYTAGHWFRKDNNSGSIPNPDDWWRLKKLLGFDDKYDKQVTEMIRNEISKQEMKKRSESLLNNERVYGPLLDKN